MSEDQSLFEGIATIKTLRTAHTAPEAIKPGHDQIVEYDVYAKVTVTTVGKFIAWQGTFEIMGEGIPQFGGPSQVEFSDGRRADILVRLDEGKTGSFVGKGFPPGYTATPSAEISSLPYHHQKFRRILSNTLFAGSAGLLTAGLWIDGKGMEFAGTGVIWIVMAIATSPRRCAHHPCQTEIKGDNDGHPDE